MTTGARRRCAIVSESLARKLSPTGEVTPIGGVREPNVAVVFRPMMQDLTRAQFPMTSIRASGDLTAVRDAYVRVVESQGHHHVRALFTLDQWIDFALVQARRCDRPLRTGPSTGSG